MNLSIEVNLTFNPLKDVDYIPEELPSRFSPGSPSEAYLLRAGIEGTDEVAPQWLLDICNEDREFNDSLIVEYEEAAAKERAEYRADMGDARFHQWQDERRERRMA